jgi:hypothetical protein
MTGSTSPLQPVPPDPGLANADELLLAASDGYAGALMRAMMRIERAKAGSKPNSAT